MSFFSEIEDRPAWMASAACRGCNAELFFPHVGANPQTMRMALAVCKTCPVTDECLEYGLMEHFGVWGGRSERERRKIRRERGIAPPPPPDRRPSCGTDNGYTWHRRHGEPACRYCLSAHDAHNRDREQR